jgi:hypothetical protein
MSAYYFSPRMTHTLLCRQSPVGPFSGREAGHFRGRRLQVRPLLPDVPLGVRPLLPFFPAMLAAMYIGALMASYFLFPPPELPQALPLPELSSPLPEISSAFLREPEILRDEPMERYLDPESREWVIGFFAQICGSPETAAIILEESERRGLSPALAFALCWEESRYDRMAVNRLNRDGSVDRGLFQLNNASFPKLGEAEFFNPRTNVYYGLAHLRLCLDLGGSEIAALAMYNAGSARVRAGGTPKQTLDYSARILSSRRKIETLFREEWSRAEARIAEERALRSRFALEESLKAPPVKQAVLFMLSPLSR